MPRPLTLDDLAQVNGTPVGPDCGPHQEQPDQPACTTKAQLQPAQTFGPAWAGVIASVIQWCQAPGASIRQGDRLTADAVCTIVGAFIYPEGDKDSDSSRVQTAIKTIWEKGSPDFDLGGMLTGWNTLAQKALGVDKEKLLNVLAVRAVLRTVADGLVGYTRTQDKSDERGLSVGI